MWIAFVYEQKSILFCYHLVEKLKMKNHEIIGVPKKKYCNVLDFNSRSVV